MATINPIQSWALGLDWWVRFANKRGLDCQKLASFTLRLAWLGLDWLGLKVGHRGVN
jgi:hypothetical protein